MAYTISLRVMSSISARKVVDSGSLVGYVRLAGVDDWMKGGMEWLFLAGIANYPIYIEKY